MFQRYVGIYPSNENRKMSKRRSTFHVPCPDPEIATLGAETDDNCGTKIQYKALKTPKSSSGFWNKLLNRGDKNISEQNQKEAKKKMYEPLMDHQESIEANLDYMEDFEKWKKEVIATQRSKSLKALVPTQVGSPPSYEEVAQEVAQEELIQISQDAETSTNNMILFASTSSVATRKQKLETLNKGSTTSADYLANSILKEFDPHNPQHAERVFFASSTSHLNWIGKMCDDISLKDNLEDSDAEGEEIIECEEVAVKPESSNAQGIVDLLNLDFYNFL